MVLNLPWAQKRMFWVFEKGIFQFFANFLLTKLKPFSGKARQCCENFLYKVCFVWSFLENPFQLLFDHSRQSLLQFLNISNVLNVSIWISHWSYSFPSFNNMFKLINRVYLFHMVWYTVPQFWNYVWQTFKFMVDRFGTGHSKIWVIPHIVLSRLTGKASAKITGLN